MKLVRQSLKLLRVYALCLIGVVTLCAQTQPDATNTRQRALEAEIVAFENADKSELPPRGAVLFIGSSSIRLWQNLATDFPQVKLINRGFGGSHLEDSINYAPRIVLPYRPRLIVMYAGDNDLNDGKTPETVAADFRRFVELVHKALPRTQIAYIAIKPSPARAALADKVLKANYLIRNYTATDRQLAFIDVFTPMRNAEGKARAELFGADKLHMNRAGYELWRDIIAPYLK